MTSKRENNHFSFFICYKNLKYNEVEEGRCMKKKLLIALICIWGVWILSYCFIRIQIEGKEKIIIHLNEPYEEFGARASFFGKSLSLEMEDNIDTKKSGTYYVCYKARNIFGISRYKKRTIIVADEEIPKITLKGNSHIILKIGETYKEPGYSAMDNIDGTITKKVKITGNVNTDKKGKYQLTYKVKDSSGNEATALRTVQVINFDMSYDPEYDKIDNTLQGWWSGNKKDHVRPLGGADINELKKYDAYFMGEDKKRMYLTFDEGANDTYINEILDVLKEKNVKATFFLCHHYIIHNKETLKRMVKDGHLVGNHTADHKKMPTLATSENFKEFKNQLKKNEEAFYKMTGSHMGMVYREPAGEWSYRSLKIVSDMGYRTYFWSADHYDFGGTVTKEKALKEFVSRHHNGAIYLIHPKNKGNYEALGDFIDQMHQLGYSFGTVDEIGN